MTYTKRPKELLLADMLERKYKYLAPAQPEKGKAFIIDATIDSTIKQLRILHEVNQELVEALKRMTDVFLDTQGNHGSSEQEAMDKARAAIAKATGEQA